MTELPPGKAEYSEFGLELSKAWLTRPTGGCPTPYRSVPSFDVDESMIGFLARSSRSISRVTGFKARAPLVRPRLRVLRVLLRGCLLLAIFPADLPSTV
jgi:hypothetical protein